LLKENGRTIERETLDTKAYDIFTGAREKGTFLIPNSYYRLMKTTQSLVDVPFDEEWWDSHVVTKIGVEMNNVFFKFQRETIYRMIKTRRCLNACSPGLGKTIQALTTLVYFVKPGVTNDIVLCPSYLRANWAEEFKKWYPALSIDVIWKAGKKEIDSVLKTVFETPGIKIVSYNMFATLCLKKSVKFNTIIMDESHFMKNGTSNRYMRTATTLKRASQVFLLTGTPSPNRSNELYTQFSIISPVTFFDYKTFAVRYCDGKYDKFNRFDDRGSSNAGELSFLMSKLSLRLRREDHLDDLPAVIRDKVVITPKTLSKTFVKKRVAFMETLATVNDSEEAKFKLQSMASEMFRDTAAIKVSPVLEYLDNYVIGAEKTILFCKHQIMLNAVSEFLSEKQLGYIKVSGMTTMKLRMDLIDKFKTDPECLFAILTTGSCSTGLNITPIRKMIFMEMEWSPSVLDQAECRINRIGGAKHLHYTYLVCENSLDDMIFNKLKKKTELITEVIDGAKRYGDFEFDTNKRSKNCI
jgi:SNF2 family DNA or RNA helicase